MVDEDEEARLVPHHRLVLEELEVELHQLAVPEVEHPEDLGGSSPLNYHRDLDHGIVACVHISTPSVVHVYCVYYLFRRLHLDRCVHCGGGSRHYPRINRYYRCGCPGARSFDRSNERAIPNERTSERTVHPFNRRKPVTSTLIVHFEI